jgi:hypothetical protein
VAFESDIRPSAEETVQRRLDPIASNRRESLDIADDQDRDLDPRTDEIDDGPIAAGEDERDPIEGRRTVHDGGGAGGFDRFGELFVTDDADALSAHLSESGTGG